MIISDNIFIDVSLTIYFNYMLLNKKSPKLIKNHLGANYIYLYIKCIKDKKLDN